MPANCLPRRSLIFRPSLRIVAGRRDGGWECNRDGRHRDYLTYLFEFLSVWFSCFSICFHVFLVLLLLFLALCPCAGVRHFVWQQRLRKRCSSAQLSCFSRSFALFRELKKVNNVKRVANFSESECPCTHTHTHKQPWKNLKKYNKPIFVVLHCRAKGLFTAVF